MLPNEESCKVQLLLGRLLAMVLLHHTAYVMQLHMLAERKPLN